MASADGAEPTWTFLTNHAHVLNCIAADPESRLRDIAARVGITERAAQAIVSDLERGGYLTRTRVGRRNTYEVHPELPFRHAIEHDHQVGELLDLLGLTPPKPRKPRGTRRSA
jgi:DNA-binding IclR family transcriptional regulator